MTLAVNTETTYDWTGKTWNVPVTAGVSQILKLGNQPLSVGVTGRYYAVRPDGVPLWGVGLVLTLSLPEVSLVVMTRRTPHNGGCVFKNVGQRSEGPELIVPY